MINLENTQNNNFVNINPNINIEKHRETGKPNQQIKLENLNESSVFNNLQPFNQPMGNNPNKSGIISNNLNQSPLMNKNDAKLLFKKLKHTKDYNDFNYSLKNHLNFLFFPCWHKKDVDQKVMIDYSKDKLDILNYFDLLNRFDIIRNFILEKEINFLLCNLNKKTLREVKDNITKCEMKEDINNLIDTYTYFKNKIDTKTLDANESKLLDMTHDAFKENFFK